jgi:GPI ethanolamine phosphate transferase 1
MHSSPPLDATALDIWVLERLRELFHNSTSNASLDASLRKDGTMFFLHLLGLDTTGHAYRPHSKVSSQLSLTLSI